MRSEFLRERPVAALTIGEDTKVDECTRSSARELVEVGIGVARVDAYAMIECELDVAFLLYRVAITDPAAIDTEPEQLFHFGAGGRVEVAAALGDERDDFIDRAGFHGVENTHARHGHFELVVGLLDLLEVEDEAGGL